MKKIKKLSEIERVDLICKRLAYNIHRDALIKPFWVKGFEKSYPDKIEKVKNAKQ